MDGFSFKRKILSSDCDRYERLRNSVLLRFLQEASIADVERVGVTRDKTLDQGFLWTVARISLSMERPVVYDETIDVHTYAGKMMHMLFPRFYDVYDHDHHRIVHASAIWVLIDQNTRKIIIPETHGINVPGVSFEESLPSGMKSMKHEIPVYKHEVAYSEIDLNGHVNNTRYMNWLDDLFGMEEMGNSFPSKLQINYEKEASFQEKICFYKEENEEEIRIDGVSGKDTVFSVKERRRKL